MNLTTIERVKRLIGNSDTDLPTTGSDNILRMIISNISGQIERWLDRYCYYQAYSEQLDSMAEQRMFSIKGYPIDIAQSVKVYNDIARVFATEIASTNLYVDALTGIIKIDGYSISAGFGAVKITYTGGLAKTTDQLITSVEAVIVNVIDGLGRMVISEEEEEVIIAGGAVEFPAGCEILGLRSGARGLFIEELDDDLKISVLDGQFQEGEIVQGVLTGDVDIPYRQLKTFSEIPLIMAYPDIAYACELQTVFVFTRRRDVGMKSVQVAGASVSNYETFKLLPEVKALLNPFRRITF